jgi:hypothetical protein
MRPDSHSGEYGFVLEDSQLSGVMLHFRLAPGERAKLFRRYVRGNLFPGIPATPRDLSWRVEWKETSIVSSGEWSTCRFGDVAMASFIIYYFG